MPSEKNAIERSLRGAECETAAKKELKTFKAKDMFLSEEKWREC